MSVTLDILRSYRAPRSVMRSILGRAPREGAALAFLMIGCGLVFVAQWPRLSRQGLDAAHAAVAAAPGALPVAEVAEDETARLMAYEAVAWLFVWPLALYLLAGLSYLALRPLAPRLTGLGARVALFWAVLASAPLGLLAGLVRGVVGEGTGATLVGLLWLGAFAAIWGLGLGEAAKG